MAGKLYGIGVGPGDPELITLKAKRILEAADCIAVPKASDEKNSTALSIVEGVLEKRGELLELVFPMSFDPHMLCEGWKEAIDAIRAKLDEDKDVAFITLGDPTVYSTYIYVHNAVKKEGYMTEIVPGITSFCASAARVGISLAENSESLAVIPSAYECENLDEVLKSFDNIVLMKVAKNLDRLNEKLKAHGLAEQSVLVSRCGHPDEMIEFDIEKASERKLSYFTTMIIKKNGVG